MKVFLSYGHEPPENKALVERIGAALHAAGFETWIDTDKIKSGDPWRSKIMEGLKTSDWTLAFLSRHAVRDPGVCLDELTIATHVKGGAIATVLIEPLADALPPPIVSHVQWIDMSDWRAREQTGGPAWDAWFQARLDEIKALLASPAAQRFTAEIDQLDRLLDPVEQAADIPPLLDGFVGREWLLAAVDARRRGPLASRLIWLTGGPGAGKSSFAAWLGTFQRANIIALNLCDARLDVRNQPTRVLRTLAFQLARAIPDYRGHLLDRLARLAHRTGNDSLTELRDLSAAEMAQLRTELAMPPDELFQWLLAEPLYHCIDGGRAQDRYLIVLDGLDETLREQESPLAELIAERAPRLPDWLAVLATSRPDKSIALIFAHLDPLRLDETSENQDDLRLYAQGWLGAADPALLDRLVAAAGGKFLYLRMLRQAVEAKPPWMRLDAPEGLPRGMAGMYRRWFLRQFPDKAAYEHQWVPLLSVLAAARLAMPLDLLAAMPRFHWTVRAQALVLQQLGSLFEVRGGALAPCHASLRDWLIDPDAAGAAFVVDVPAGRRMLADALWPRLVDLLDTPPGTLPDAFTLAELPAQIVPQDPPTLRAYLASAGDWQRVQAQLVDIIAISERKFDWRTALDWLGMLDKLGDATGDEGLPARRWALVETGDIQLTIGQTEPALAAFRHGTKVGERLATLAPENVDWQRDFSVSHNKIGDVLVAQGELPQAEQAFRAGMDIARRLAEQDPGNAQWQRDLSVSLERIGNVLVAQGELPQAEQAFRAGMDIARRLAEQDPGNAQWQRDLSVSLERIGDVLVAQGELPQAEQAFRAGIDIRKRLAEQDPGNAEWQRDLSVSLDRIGDVLVAQGELPQAEQAFRAGMDIRKRLAEQDPGNAQWQRDLSVSHNNIGDVLVAQGELPQAEQAFRAGIDIARRLAEQDPGNAQWQRDLSVSHNNIGDVLVAQGELPQAEQAFRAGIDIARRLAEQDPGNAQWQRDVIVSCVKLALADPPHARAPLTQALGIARALAASGRLAPVDAWLPAELERRLAAAPP